MSTNETEYKECECPCCKSKLIIKFTTNFEGVLIDTPIVGKK